MKEEILVVFNGSSHPQAEQAYSNIEGKIQLKYPTMQVSRAYTSKVSRERLLKQNIQVNSVEGALLKMAADEVDHILVLPCMVFSNSSCLEMMADFMIHGEKFKAGISLFRVMLDLTADYEIFANAFFAAVMPPERTAKDAVVLIAHSPSEQFKVLGMVLKQRDNNTFISTLDELPNMSTLCDELKQAKIKKVYLVPLMMAAGIHVHRDMAKTTCQSIEAADIECIPIAKGLGEYDRIAQLMANHIIADR